MRVVVEFVDLGSTEPEKVHVRYPFLCRVDHAVPGARHDVDVEEHVNDELDDLQSSFDLLARVSVHDHTVKPLDPQNLKEAEHIQVRREQFERDRRYDVNVELAAL